MRRLYRFLRKPWHEKMRSLRFRFKRFWNRFLPFVPLPTRLPFGGWWLAWNDVCGDAIFTGDFEESECRFMECFLREGMMVLRCPSRLLHLTCLFQSRFVRHSYRL